MDIAESFNYFEIILWVALGIVIFVKTIKTSGKSRFLGLISTMTFFVFAVSDAIEIQTGAWWKPWWLLVIKASCLICLLICLVLYLKSKER